MFSEPTFFMKAPIQDKTLPPPNPITHHPLIKCYIEKNMYLSKSIFYIPEAMVMWQSGPKSFGLLFNFWVGSYFECPSQVGQCSTGLAFPPPTNCSGVGPGWGT